MTRQDPARAARSASSVHNIHLGDLELRVLEALWARPHLDARQVREQLTGPVPGPSTVQSALERLYRKQYVDRYKQGAAYVYFASVSRAALLGRMLTDVIHLLHDGRMETILSSFVHVASDLDDRSLDDLQALIDRHKKLLGNTHAD